MITSFDYAEEKIIDASTARDVATNEENAYKKLFLADLMLAMASIERASISGRYETSFAIVAERKNSIPRRVKMLSKKLSELGYAVESNMNSVIGCIVYVSWKKE